MTATVPKRGDVIWLTFDPQAGHEQAGRRPALVISPETYNQTTGLMQACPITSRVKGYPFEVLIPAGLGVSGVVLADQIKSLDWKARRAEIAAVVDANTLAEVMAKILTLIEVD